MRTQKEPRENCIRVHVGTIRPLDAAQYLSPRSLIGDCVKICFYPRRLDRLGGGGEWMWVEVIDASDAHCIGRLDNDPFVPAIKRRWKQGDLVVFKPAEITQIETAN